MKICVASLLCLLTSSVCAFSSVGRLYSKGTSLKGYLDDLSKELYQPVDNPDIEGDKKENTDLPKDKIERFGPGDWSTFTDFSDEFDGGDGQMGVAGDGNKGLEKFGSDVTPQLATSRAMSAKNSWGKSTGYAESLIDKGVETQRAQQIENWRNQQEIRAVKNAQRKMTESFDEVTYEEDWRSLSKFGVERNQEFDLDETFGSVTLGPQLDGVIELNSRMNQPSVHELSIKNEYMGFADFRAAFTPETSADWSVEPREGSLTSREPTTFLVRFRPNSPGFQEGYLVIETEDMKKTFRLAGATA
mmetsp:Transcript_8688/g.12630  ORF Transcript_8688/g.12630 Transcript_8688/m.12630 type:complete len:303 (+) Transcript_8688:42-950(+)